VFVACSFLLYDRFVQRRSDKLAGAALRTTKLIASLFPSNVHERLFGDDSAKPSKKGLKASLKAEAPIVPEDGNPMETKPDASGDIFKTRPIADLFPNTTTLFGVH